MFEIYHYFNYGKEAVGNALLIAIPRIYASALHMVFSHNAITTISGILIVTGMSNLLIRGMWKVLAKAAGHNLSTR